MGITNILLKGPHMDLHRDRLTQSEFQHWGSCSKNARNIGGDSLASEKRLKGKFYPGQKFWQNLFPDTKQDKHDAINIQNSILDGVKY